VVPVELAASVEQEAQAELEATPQVDLSAWAETADEEEKEPMEVRVQVEAADLPSALSMPSAPQPRFCLILSRSGWAGLVGRAQRGLNTPGKPG